MKNITLARMLALALLSPALIIPASGQVREKALDAVADLAFCGTFSASARALALSLNGVTAAALNCATVSNLPPFMDPLPIPPKARPARTHLNYRVPVATNMFYASIPEYDMPMTSFMHSFHTNLPPVEVWGYAGSYPGPTFDVNIDEPILVNWINQLPTNYPSWLPVDLNLHGVPDQTVRTVTHLHGGATLPRYDGFPENWYRTGQSDQYFYGNLDFDGDGQTLWYHDHAVGATANNVYAGLAGFYILRNPTFENGLNLPKGDYEIPLVFQDREIQTNCAPPSLYVGQVPWGSLPVVNGKITPYLDVEPRRYRFRVLDGSNFRTYGLSLVITDRNGNPIPNAPPAPSFNVIGTEDGFLQKTVIVPSTNMVPIMPGERVDFIVDFTKFTNATITMTNLIINGDVPFPPYITNLMQFRVMASIPTNSPPDTSSIPSVIVPNLRSLTNLMAQVVRTREFALDMNTETPFPGLPFVSGSNYPKALINMKYFHEAADDLPHAGDTEIWSILNFTSDAHPFHVHLTDFRVIDRTRFGGWNTNDDLAYPPTMVTNYVNDRISHTLKPLAYYLSTNTNDVFTVRAFENGPKDVVRAAPFSVTRIVITWPTNAMFYTTPSAMSLDPATDGIYVYHCHILDHEDNDMMRPFQLLAPYIPSLAATRNPLVNVTGQNHFSLGLQTRSNENYRIQSTLDLSVASPTWLPIPPDPIVGSGSLIQINPPSSTNRAGFYRVQLIPQQ